MMLFLVTRSLPILRFHGAFHICNLAAFPWCLALASSGLEQHQKWTRELDLNQRVAELQSAALPGLAIAR